VIPLGQEHCTVIEKVGVGVISVDEQDFGNVSASGAALDMDSNVDRISDVRLDRSKAKVRPATTMATSERPRAMVLVKACCSTLTAFSQGEAPVWPNAGAARNRATAAVLRNRKRNIDERKRLQRDMFTGMPARKWECQP
jgi:hypothetical protein